jgi:methionyl-tRNA formyltransferase
LSGTSITVPADRPLRLVFCGTPEFAVPSLAACVGAGHNVALVITQPDRPQGRSMQLVAPPVKVWAVAHGLTVEQPETLRNHEALRARLESIAPDAIAVVAYGRIIPSWMLHLPPLGNINVHGSLLPKYRGAAPIQWAIAKGEVLTGVTTMLLEKGLDTGPMLEQAELPIPPDATAADLFPQLAALGASLLLSTLASLAAGTLSPTLQDDALATLAPILKRADGLVDFTLPASTIFNRWRGFQPWPGAFTLLNGKKLALTTLKQNGPVTCTATDGQVAPGSLLLEGNQLFVACGDRQWLEIAMLQPEGKRAMLAADFLRGHYNLAGAHFG